MIIREHLTRSELLLLVGFVVNLSSSTITGADKLQAATTQVRSNTSPPQPALLYPSANHCPSTGSCKNQLNITNVQNVKRSCYCDSKCLLYDDCCSDSPRAINFTERQSIGLNKLKATRQQWHCYRVNPVFGDVLLKATCSPSWIAAGSNDTETQSVQKRCELIRTRRTGNEAGDVPDEYYTDPIGMMMPITDLSSGITYANSYCLRCNKLAPIKRLKRSDIKPKPAPTKQPKLIYWSPLLECNYNLDTDDRNTLFDLITSNKGQALYYSAKRKKWIINLPSSINNASAAGGEQFERICSIVPTVPDSVEQHIRYCNSYTIDRCSQQAAKLASNSSQAMSNFQEIQLECHFGHQALVYSQSNVQLAYHNLACAKCNNEKQVSCEPKMIMPHTSKTPSPAGKIIVNDQGMDPRNQPISPDDFETIAGLGRSSGSTSNQPISGSFSVLIDLYPSSQGDEQVGTIYQCPDADNQVYDPFLLACRDAVCGLDHQLVDGNCVWQSHDKTENLTHANLVEKFKPPMAYLTAVCLIISIASLAMYLVLYCLSMFDFRNLVVEMAQAGLKDQIKNNPLGNTRFSRDSNDSYLNANGAGNASRASCQIGARSQSLSSRGVACLAGSLLAAYLFFILGHSQKMDPTNLSANLMTSISCFCLAIGTYYCFLLSFNWMFLLSYDVWRTLRLATCQLRGPALNSKQSKRFIVYTLFAFISAGLIVGLAVLVDQFPDTCEPVLPPSNLEHCNNQLGNFIHNYRPKFGQKLTSCWFTNRRALALFFGLPVTVIMLVNLIFFLHSSYMVIRTSSRSSRHFSQASGNSSNCSYQHSNINHVNTQPAKLIAVISKTNDLAEPNNHTNMYSLDQHNGLDYSHQNGLTTSSLTSVKTMQSNILPSDSSNNGSSSDELNSDGGESPPPKMESKDGASMESRLLSSQISANIQSDYREKRRILEASLSSCSLTNQSIKSNNSTITSGLAKIKYDQHFNNLSCMMSSVIKDYRLYCRLSTIMGLTWLTGLIASLVDQSDILWYLFVILNTLQGLFIFIAFGCKRSKLSNLEILLNYLKFRVLIKKNESSVDDDAKMSPVYEKKSQGKH